MAAIVPDDEEAGPRGAGERPRQREEVGRRDGDEVDREGDRRDGHGHRAPSAHGVDVKDRGRQGLDDVRERHRVGEFRPDGAVPQRRRQRRAVGVGEGGRSRRGVEGRGGGRGGGVGQRGGRPAGLEEGIGGASAVAAPAPMPRTQRRRGSRREGAWRGRAARGRPPDHERPRRGAALRSWLAAEGGLPSLHSSSHDSPRPRSDARAGGRLGRGGGEGAHRRPRRRRDAARVAGRRHFRRRPRPTAHQSRTARRASRGRAGGGRGSGRRGRWARGAARSGPAAVTTSDAPGNEGSLTHRGREAQHGGRACTGTRPDARCGAGARAARPTPRDGARRPGRQRARAVPSRRSPPDRQDQAQGGRGRAADNGTAPAVWQRARVAPAQAWGGQRRERECGGDGWSVRAASHAPNPLHPLVSSSRWPPCSTPPSPPSRSTSSTACDAS